MSPIRRSSMRINGFWTPLTTVHVPPPNGSEQTTPLAIRVRSITSALPYIASPLILCIVKLVISRASSSRSFRRLRNVNPRASSVQRAECSLASRKLRILSNEPGYASAWKGTFVKPDPFRGVHLQCFPRRYAKATRVKAICSDLNMLERQRYKTDTESQNSKVGETDI